MIHYFFRTITGRILLILLIFMTVSLATSWFIINFTSQSIMSSEKEGKLLVMASLLDYHLGDRSYNDILEASGAENTSSENKIAVLNLELSGLGEEMVKDNPDLGIGYYSLELDAILTYAPSELYQHTIGLPIGQDHPGRIVMQNNKSMVRTGSMVRGNIMNAMHLIARNGVVIGYAWANELASSIERQYRRTTTSILLFLSLFYLFSVIMAIIFAQRSTRDINNIVDGVRQLHSDLSYSIPKASGDLGEVVDGINSMAREILKAEKEHKARLLTDASNYAKRDFLSRMSHELRTPMNGVLGMTRLAQNADTDEQRMLCLNKIHSSATLLLRIINDILDISKIEAGKMTIESHPFHVKKIIDNICDMILPRTQETGLEFRVLLDDSVPEVVVGDGLRISQILLNIIGNAVKFTEEGFVTLSLSARELTNHNLQLQFSVRDTGIGMSEKQQHNLFTPFTQADSSTARKYGGTGLGLSISKALIELMNGKISVESSLGQGSIFTFNLDVLPYTGGTLQAEESGDLAAYAQYSGLSLLLVEDIEINQEIAKAILSDLGFNVDVANNGYEGVEAFISKDYDVIFMDIRMPTMDGLEAAREIREIEEKREYNGAPPSHVPIIAMTANAMQEDRDATREAGMDGHVSKPIDIKELLQILKKTLDC